MDSTTILLNNLTSFYGNLKIASTNVGLRPSTLYNWSTGHSKPNLAHLEKISQSSQINASYWIQEDFLKVRSQKFFNQQLSLSHYFRINIKKQLIYSGKRRRNIVYDFFDGADIMSPDTFDDYQNGKINAVPLFRLDQLGKFFNCPPYKLIEVTENEKER